MKCGHLADAVADRGGAELMSGRSSARAPAPLRRIRPVIDRSPEQVARGATAEALGRPAGPILESIPWDGPDPDPDYLAAQTFLGWL